jgi:spore maturation protein CgeB
MKILFLGELGMGQTSRMRMRAFARLGHQVHGVNTIEPWKQVSWLQRQVQRRIQRGGVPEVINKAVLDRAKEFRPDIIWAEKQEYLNFETIEKVKKLGIRLIHFTPDPYFYLRWKRTRIMDEAIRAYDILVYCKSYERESYEALGRPLIYMPLGFCDEVHRPLQSGDPRWTCAVGFVGGWEPRRERLLRAVSAANLDLKIWGKYWDFLRDGKWTLRRYLILRQLAGKQREGFAIRRDQSIGRAWQGDEIYDDDYALALTGSKIGLGFLRNICPDQHTTRTFEIPACGSMLLADRTSEHREFFEEGKEADFFESEAEFTDKVVFYCNHDSTRSSLAHAGYRRCIQDRYAYIHRLKAVLEHLSKL